MLCLCLLTVGLTAYFTRTAGGAPVEAPPVTVYASPTSSPAAVALQRATILPAATPIPLKLPAEKARLGMEYSGPSLSYNETVDDWRLHGGVDYLGEENTPVRAVFNGRVARIYEDPLLGMCLVLEDTDGHSCLYASLSEEVLAEEGMAVSAGQTIGFMGETALLEREEGFHVHVELYDGDRCISGQLPLP